MKLLFQRKKIYKEHVTYLAELEDKNVYLTLQRRDLVGQFEEGIAFSLSPPSLLIYIHTSSKDKSKHLCHKCKELYPAFQYAKHAKERH